MFKRISVFFITTIFLLSSCGVLNNKGELDTNKNRVDEKKALDFQVSFFEANKQKMLGNYKEAGGYYLRCLSIKPKDGASNYELARILSLGEDYSSAIKYAEKAHEYNPENKWYHALYISLTKNLGDYKKASNMLEEMLKKHPNDYNSYLELTDLYLHMNNDKKALETLNHFEEQYGSSEPLMVEKNRIYIKNKDYRSARKEAQKMIDLEPNNPNYQTILADLYAEEGQYDKAYEVYNKVLEMDPDNGAVHFSLSEYHRRKGNDKESYQELKKAFESDKIDVELKARLMFGYFKIENPTKKEQNQIYELINILRKNYPKNAQVRSVYSDMLIKDKRYKEAQEELGSYIIDNPDKLNVWEQLLYVDNQLVDFDSLYVHAVKMIDYFPNQSMAYFFAGLGGYQLGKNKEATEYLETGLDFTLEDKKLKAQFYTLLGDSYHRLKNNEKSDKAYDKSIELEPKNYYVINNYSFYLALRKEKLDKAEKMMEDCYKAHPKNATFLDTYAWVLFQQKKYKEALSIIEKAYQNGGTKSGAIVEHYGDILHKNKLPNKALDKWKEAQKIGGGTDQLNSKVISGKLIDK